MFCSELFVNPIERDTKKHHNLEMNMMNIVIFVTSLLQPQTCHLLCDFTKPLFHTVRYAVV